MKTEMAHSASKEAVEKFDKNNMKHVETQEKNPLPDGEGNLYFFKKCTIFLALRFLNNFDSKVRNGSEPAKIIIFYTFFQPFDLRPNITISKLASKDLIKINYPKLKLWRKIPCQRKK